MTAEQLRKRLSDAGSKHGGLVTHGSLGEQMGVVLEALIDSSGEACSRFIKEIAADELSELRWKLNNIKEKQIITENVIQNYKKAVEILTAECDTLKEQIKKVCPSFYREENDEL